MPPFASAQRIHFGIFGIPFTRCTVDGFTRRETVRLYRGYGFIAATASRR